MDENEMVNALEAIFGGDSDAAYDLAADVTRIQTFAQAGVLTSDRGLVVCIDGSEFQITVVRSR